MGRSFSIAVATSILLISVQILGIMPVYAVETSIWDAPYRFSPGNDEHATWHPYSAGFVTLDSIAYRDKMTRVKGLEVTVSFAGATGIPANIEEGNYVGAGIAATSFDNESQPPWSIDYAWSFVMYLNSSGGPYFQMECWAILEWFDDSACWLSKGYYRSDISVGEQVTLRMEFGGESSNPYVWYILKTADLTAYIYQFYLPWTSMNAEFALGVKEAPWYSSHWGELVKYFQFPGAWSAWEPAYTGWQVGLTNPRWKSKETGLWGTAYWAYATQGPLALLDYQWAHGGLVYDTIQIRSCNTGYNYDPPNKAIFCYTGDPAKTTPHLASLWDINDFSSGGGGGGGYGLFLR